MATTTLTEPRRKYDPNLTIRVPTTVREALQAMARERKGTITDVVREFVEPFQLFASKEGQEAYERIRLAITESTAVNKSLPKERFAGSWRGLTVNVLGVEWEELFERQVPTSEVRCGHIVRQREGRTRSEAIRSYADTLWKEWATVPASERGGVLAEITDPTKHIFVMGYVTFSKWRSFPSPYEASLHRAWYVEDSLPEGAETAQEASFLVQAARHLTRLWLDKVHPRPELDLALIGFDAIDVDTPVILQGASPPLPVFNEDAIRLLHYPQVSNHENVNTWARQLLKLWRSKPGVEAEEIIFKTFLQAEVLTIKTA